MSESFQRLSGSALRASNRLRCSSKETENQYLITVIPERTSIRSNSGHERRNSWCSSSVAVAHHPLDVRAVVPGLRSNRTISPADGRCSTYRWKYHWVRLALGGLGQRDDPDRARAGALGDPLDHPALAGRAAALEDHQDPEPLPLDPVLEHHELFLEPLHLRVVDGLLDLAPAPACCRRRRAGCRLHRPAVSCPRTLLARRRHWAAPTAANLRRIGKRAVSVYSRRDSRPL